MLAKGNVASIMAKTISTASINPFLVLPKYRLEFVTVFGIWTLGNSRRSELCQAFFALIRVK